MAKTRLNHIIRFFKNYLYPTRILRRFAPQLATLTEFHPILLGNAIATLRHQQRLKSAPIYAAPEGAVLATSWFGDAMWVHYFASIKAEVKNISKSARLRVVRRCSRPRSFPSAGLPVLIPSRAGPSIAKGKSPGLRRAS